MKVMLLVPLLIPLLITPRSVETDWRALFDETEHRAQWRTGL